MMNAKKFGEGYCLSPHTGRRTGTLTCSPIRLPKGGQRWNNISDKGGVING